MKFARLAAYASLSIALLGSLASCEREEDETSANVFQKTDIPATGAQIRPTASPSTGSGKLTASYDKRNQTLSYTINWTGLSDSVIAIRITGPAPTGYNAVNPAFTGANPTAFATTPYTSLQTFTGTGVKPLYPSTGSFTGTLLVDGVKVKEQDLLNGLYYITVHTKTTLPVPAPGSFLYRWFGEIRAQIVLK